MEIKPLGENALLVQLEQEISEKVLMRVLHLHDKLKSSKIDGIKELVPAYNSLAIYFDNLLVSHNKLHEYITSLGEEAISQTYISSEIHEIPVCYDDPYAPDMEHVMNITGLSRNEVIKVHTSVIYTIYMLGFIPGFLYLGILDKNLHVPRKSSPSPTVAPGSIALGGQQTGIYSLPSPAGWHVIGKTPMKIFDATREEMMLFNPGDRIKFKAISIESFNKNL